MKSVWIRRLIPASVVAVVLAFSYIAPALGGAIPPVNQASLTNCGRFGYGYHGGKHLFVCPSPEGPPPAVRQVRPLAKNETPAAPSKPVGSSPTSQPTPVISNSPTGKSVVDVPVSVGVNQWRAFSELVLRELS